MSIQRRKGCKFFYYAVYVGKTDGKDVYLRGSTGATDEATAKAVEQTIKMSIRKQATPEKLHALIDVLSGVQAKDALPIEAIYLEYERFLTATKKNLAPKTNRSRKRLCEKLAKWCAGRMIVNIDQIGKQTALQFAEHLAKQGVKGKTRANAIGDLSAVWGALMRTRDNLANPWQHISPSQDDSERGKAFERDEEIKLMQTAKEIGNGWHLACMIARHSGLRYGDVAALTWDNIDFDKLAIRITPKKTARHKISVTIPLAPEVANLLEDELTRKTSTFILPRFAEAGQCGFQNPRFAKVLKSAGLEGKGYTFHSWRHTFRTRLSEAGVSDDIAKRLGGWTDDKTVQRYDHAERLDELRAAINKSRTPAEES